MPPSMVAYFEKPEKVYERFQKVVKFQLTQKARLGLHLFNELPQQLRKVHKEVNAMLKLKAKLTSELDEEKKRFEKQKRYLAYMQNSMEMVDTKRTHKTDLSDAMSNLKKRLTTPTLSASVSESFKSTGRNVTITSMPKCGVDFNL
ncbi:RING finger protein nenya-like [Teleopsis dalmanni]|uniref:RING finger protein nenya-like n=1 Tax=Teleopsis dalmanni TaxID=139649 RepID=UPI0018CD8D97|nr:RING finger protein nenya-like [Teleopsis dalmanni]